MAKPQETRQTLTTRAKTLVEAFLKASIGKRGFIIEEITWSQKDNSRGSVTAVFSGVTDSWDDQNKCELIERELKDVFYRSGAHCWRVKATDPSPITISIGIGEWDDQNECFVYPDRVLRAAIGAIGQTMPDQTFLKRAEKIQNSSHTP